MALVNEDFAVQHHSHLPMGIFSLNRPHPFSQAQPLQNLGYGPQPLFGWASVQPLSHSYGQPKNWKQQKPDYRRFCYSVGKAEVPYAALPGGPLHGFPTYMSENVVKRW
ncbi:uncharacterized protein I206_100952 [Kwoniella pini CBS 10737]|uniref:Uncharacterized protein n=1 Tax=Kwoniella pini CBS 10737 TaxID=1296096 RepID=A0A1B9IC81_9TREE|nr:uncharacterized protein I206_00374 [Kwoniella pini CBS 10737]OCF53073.1 hypothetical protein I206_00374 [Kwoniella pini CBS 10737]